MIEYLRGEGLAPTGRRILDCGAGGRLPPLALFHEHQFDCFGIDVSQEYLDLARTYCREQGLDMDLRLGDMREIPFDDAAFDFVYEHYAMCHLSKADTARAVAEMYRVLKTGGLCFLGMICDDTWPRSLYGEERRPGEYWGHEEGSGEEQTLHSMWSDAEAERLVTGWDVMGCEKRSICLRDRAQDTTMDEWMALRAEEENHRGEQQWIAAYRLRAYQFRYTHLYYYLRKPSVSSHLGEAQV
jgi:SAM-dependent methyltransferase